MKIIEMCRTTENGEKLVDPECDPHDWWGVMETKAEQLVYEDFVEHLGKYGGDMRNVLWNKILIEAGKDMGVCWGDDDMYGYLEYGQDVPEIGEETMDSDGDMWVRTK